LANAKRARLPANRRRIINLTPLLISLSVLLFAATVFFAVESISTIRLVQTLQSASDLAITAPAWSMAERLALWAVVGTLGGMYGFGLAIYYYRILRQDLADRQLMVMRLEPTPTPEMAEAFQEAAQRLRETSL
jgi:hypothetical protein